MDLKRIEVIADDAGEIAEAAQRMSRAYDLVVTSGGIGPTHDDITYASLASAFSAPLALHAETATRMRTITSQRPNTPPTDWDVPSPALSAKMRMATLPSGPGTAALFVSDALWVPIAVVNHNVHVLPGIPRLFVQLLEGLRGMLLAQGRVDPARRQTRVLISTPLPESDVAAYLGDLQERVTPRGVKVGSYPRWGNEHNTITLVGADVAYIESLVAEVERETRGARVAVEGEDDAPEKTAEALADADAQRAGGKDAKERAQPASESAIAQSIAALKVGE